MAKQNTNPRINPLTAAEVAVLAVAVQRHDGAIVLPTRLKGKAGSVLGASLMAEGIAREVRAKPGLPAWRQDAETGKSFALLITKAGRAAAPLPETDTAAPDQGAGPVMLGVIDRSQQSDARVSEAGSSKADPDGPIATDSGDLETAFALRAATPRPHSKLSGVIRLLERETGASIADLMAATGWLPHTIRAALTGLRKRGFAVTTERRHGTQTTYRIQTAPAAQVA